MRRGIEPLLRLSASKEWLTGFSNLIFDSPAKRVKDKTTETLRTRRKIWFRVRIWEFKPFLCNGQRHLAEKHNNEFWKKRISSWFIRWFLNSLLFWQGATCSWPIHINDSFRFYFDHFNPLNFLAIILWVGGFQRAFTCLSRLHRIGCIRLETASTCSLKSTIYWGVNLTFKTVKSSWLFSKSSSASLLQGNKTKDLFEYSWLKLPSARFSWTRLLIWEGISLATIKPYSSSELI